MKYVGGEKEKVCLFVCDHVNCTLYMEVNSKQYHRTSKMFGAGGVDILTPGRGRLPAGEREGYT